MAESVPAPVPPATKRNPRAGGRPSLYTGSKKPRTLMLTDEAYEKAEDDARVMSKREGIRVSISESIEAAIRAFRSRGKS